MPEQQATITSITQLSQDNYKNDVKKTVEFLFYLIPMGREQIAKLTSLINCGLQLLIELRNSNGRKIAITRIDRKNRLHRAKSGNSQYYAMKIRVQDVGKPSQLILRCNSSTKWLLDFCYLHSTKYE